MTVDELTVNELTVDELTVNELTVDELTWYLSVITVFDSLISKGIVGQVFLKINYLSVFVCTPVGGERIASICWSDSIAVHTNC